MNGDPVHGDPVKDDAVHGDAVSDDVDQRAGASPVLTGLVVLLIVALGLPQVWADLHSRSLGIETVFFPVLGVAFGYLAVVRR